MDPKRCVAYNPLSRPHYIDHLAPLCPLMEMPLLCSHPRLIQEVPRYYPDVELRAMEPEALTPQFLTAEHEMVFLSDCLDLDQVRRYFAPLEQHHEKKLTFVYVPHGFSDKVFPFQRMAHQEVLLAYGENMIDLLKEEGVFSTLGKVITTGNYRLNYYRQHQSLHDRLAQEEVFDQFAQTQTTLLYGPTWNDFEGSTTLFEVTDSLIAALPASWNLLIKLHPHSLDTQKEATEALIQKHQHLPNVLFLDHYLTVYPLLARADFFLGDMSSLGYDYLAFDRPLFFLNSHQRDPQRDRRALLQSCGTPILPQDFHRIPQVIEEAVAHSPPSLAEKRREMFHYTYAPPLSPPALREAVLTPPSP